MEGKSEGREVGRRYNERGFGGESKSAEQWREDVRINRIVLSFIYYIPFNFLDLLLFICLTVYSLFALSEYVAVLSNIAFHSTLMLDLKGVSLHFDHRTSIMSKKY